LGPYGFKPAELKAAIDGYLAEQGIERGAPYQANL
jgi:hypothetical protein